MENLTQHHISQQFDIELRELRHQVLSMGGMVEEQLAKAIVALTTNNAELGEQVYASDYKVNALEVAIDEHSTHILVRRQPTASDLRLVMAVVKTITDLERIGDEAKRIAHLSIDNENMQAKYCVAISHLGDHVQRMLHGTLDSFARMDIDMALQILHEDIKVDYEYESLSRQLITYMMEDPRAIPVALNIMWSARALERIADHSCNVCEYVIYFVKGKDVRHTSLEQVDKQAKNPR
ncbi:MAG: phosphate transport system regulatory protein PhoU [Thiotrichaceae bacterium IS1]|nr:MAG: phosphate transport system regulatory protein PhoU [Thiotrichaceae bacterium IS1]